MVVLDYSINTLNKDLKNVQKCRELIKSSSDASDVCEDYLRLSKEEIGEIYKSTSDILNTLLDNINVLKQIPKTHWYTAAIAFIIDAYAVNENLEESIKLYNNSISSMLSENQETDGDVLATIEESQDNAITRASFIKSLLNRNEEFGILVPEIQKIRLPNAGNKKEKETPVIEEKEAEVEEKAEKVAEKEQRRKTVFEVLRANRGE